MGSEMCIRDRHIGAYQLKTSKKTTITFIDTPGHAAFTSMRSRGTKVTDIVVIVVAANDGVMPQTIEAINHSKEANVPIIVAINKIDLDGADPNRVRNELLVHEVIVESHLVVTYWRLRYQPQKKLILIS